MRRTSTYIVAILCSVALCLGSATLASATQTSPTTITASPAVIDVGGQAGQSIPFIFELTNGGDTALPLHLTSRDSRLREGQSEASMNTRSATSWVSFAESDFILVSGERREVRATLHIPDNASGGGYYADIIVQPLSFEGTGESIVARPELAVQLFASITGDINEELTVSPTGPSSVVIGRQSRSTLSYTIQNKGNTHTLFTPKLELHNKKHSLVIDSAPEILLPGERKVVSFTIPSNIELRMYSAQVRFTYGAPGKDAIGPETRIIVLPFSPTLLLVFLLLPIASATYFYHERLKRAIYVLVGKKSR